jgi:hypothetical protein
MLNLQNNRSIYIYGAAAISLAAVGTGIAYYIIEDDRQVRRRKTARRAERTTLRLLHQIKEEEQTIEAKMNTVENTIDDTACDDKAFRLKEYTLAHSNELLLQLMEKLDAIRPLTAIMGAETEADPNDFERSLVTNVKTKKRSVIESIEGLFRRLDIANGQVKKEASRREQVAKEKARLEKEEAERKAQEEKEEAERKAQEEREREELRKENERKLREEQEKIAQEESLRRQKEEEEERLLKEEEVLRKRIEEEEALNKSVKEEVLNKPIEEAGQETGTMSQEQVVLAALNEVEQEDK